MKAIGDVQRHEGGGPLAFRKVIQWKGSPVGRFAALGSYAHRCGAHNQWLVTGEEITRMITLLKLLLRRRKLLHCDARRARVHKQAPPHVLVRGGRAQFSARVSHFFTGAHNSESSSVMTGLDLDDRLIETLRAAAATIFFAAEPPRARAFSSPLAARNATLPSGRQTRPGFTLGCAR
jgi:hypothetical protein